MICPHCGGNYGQGAPQHIEHCFARREVLPLVLACLMDTERAGVAVAHNIYTQRRAALPKSQRPPSSIALCAALGSWGSVCSYYGLTAPGRTARHAIAANRAKAREIAHESARVLEIGQEIDAELRRQARSHYRNWGLLVVSTRMLPDGRFAHLLR